MSGSIWRRPTTWALVASLILNVFLGAAFLGRAFGGPPDHFGRGPGAMRAFLEEAPPEMRDVARRIERERHESFRQERETMREAFGRIRELMRSEPFDRDGFMAAQAEAREARNRMRALSDDGLIELLSQMDAEARQALAERLERRWRERREARKRWREEKGERREDEPPRPGE